MSYLGIDFGTKNLGLAISEGFLARPFGILTNDDKLIGKLSQIINTENVEKIVIGTPGAHTQMGKQIEKFGQNLKKYLDLEIVFWDETLTTVEAQNLAKKSGDLDSISAAIILQSYLDNNKQSFSGE